MAAELWECASDLTTLHARAYNAPPELSDAPVMAIKMKYMCSSRHAAARVVSAQAHLFLTSVPP